MKRRLVQLGDSLFNLEDLLANRGEPLAGPGSRLLKRDDNVPIDGNRLEGTGRPHAPDERTGASRRVWIPSLEDGQVAARERAPDGGAPTPVLHVVSIASSRMRATAHHVLIVEDDPKTAADLSTYVRSVGMTCDVAATLVEVDAALATGRFCCALLDKQIPFSEGALALASTGDLAQKRIRATDPRRNGADHHVFPIIVITAAAADLAAQPQAAFISKNFRDGASAYIPKPFDAVTVTTELLAVMERAGRADHGACGALEPVGATPGAQAARSAPPAAEPPSEGPVVVLVLDALRAGRRMTFLVNGKRRELQDAQFVSLFRLCAERARGSLAWLPARDLGVVRAPEIPSRIRTSVADAVPEGFSILQRSDAGIRLHPLVAVGAIAWEAFERDANPVIQAVATAERKRR